MEGFEELKNSKEDSDKEIANTFSPRKRYLAYCLFYKDKRGDELDEDLSPRFVMLTSGMYQDIIEYFLDEDEWGDMTDPKTGYDLKLSRVGSGMKDTEYSVSPCKNTPMPKKYRNEVYDLDEQVQKILPSYEDTEKLLTQFLGLSKEDGKGKKKKKKKKIVKKKSDAD